MSKKILNGKVVSDKNNKTIPCATPIVITSILNLWCASHLYKPNWCEIGSPKQTYGLTTIEIETRHAIANLHKLQAAIYK